MMSYTHLTLEERKKLEKFLSEGKKQSEIARALGRSPSTISREIKRNRAKQKPHREPKNPQWYHHWRAQSLTIARRRNHALRAIPKGSLAWDFVVYGLNHFWSPEEICGRWSVEHPEEKPLHFSTIYRYIANNEFEGIQRKTHLRRRGKRKNKKESKYQTIHPERLIPQWPEEIRQRARIGDWEGDTVYGGIGKGAVVTLVDRKSRFLRVGLLAKRDALLTKNVIETQLAGLPASSISFDNGSEFAEFRALEKELHSEVYFAEPHKPWQRGTNENTNDILRFFFPKGFDFRTVTQTDVDYVVALINSRPRKCLGWKTPAEVFWEKIVALT